MKKLATASVLALSLVLAGCANVETKFATWAVSMERSQASLELKQIVVDDFTTPYLEGGQGDTVLLLHGFQSNKDIWIRMAKQLTKHYHVIAIDLPAHGDSNILMDKSYTVPEQAKRVIAMMKKLQLTQPVHIMGHSMGGAIAFHVAYLAPNHVKSLALMNSAGVVSPQPSELYLRNQKGENPLIVRNEADYQKMLDFTMSDAPYIPSPVIATLTRVSLAREKIGDKIYQELNLKNSLNPEEVLPQIKVPTFILWGKEDKVIHVSSTEVFKRLIPQAQVVIFDNVGHAPQLERTKESAQAYETFLARVKR
jgi:abhydrolase domain-containing protein 6